MVDKFKEMNNDEQKKILGEMVEKLNSLSSDSAQFIVLSSERISCL